MLLTLCFFKFSFRFYKPPPKNKSNKSKRNNKKKNNDMIKKFRKLKKCGLEANNIVILLVPGFFDVLLSTKIGILFNQCQINLLKF